MEKEVGCLEKAAAGLGGVSGWAGVRQGGQGLEQQRVGAPVGDFGQCDKHPRETFCRRKCMVWLMAVEVSAWVCPLPRA